MYISNIRAYINEGEFIKVENELFLRKYYRTTLIVYVLVALLKNMLFFLKHP